MGSIETDSGFGSTTLEGIEIHQTIQQKKLFADPAYRAEVRITHQFVTDSYTFEVSGRMDGMYLTNPCRIEEIKSSFNILKLQQRLLNSPDTHPYCLQLKTYGYFYWLQNGTLPELTFHLVSTRTRAVLELQMQLDVSLYEKWLAQRLVELVAEATARDKRIQRRKKSVRKFDFPFAQPRPGQDQLMAAIEEGMRDKQPQLIQAPTGLGKTIGVLYPLLKEALARGQKIIYLTPKNSQHRLAENAVARLQKNGANIKAMTLTAKTKMCFKDEPLCNPDYCEYARDHYTKLAAAQLPQKLAKKKTLTAEVFRKLAREHEVCPFDLQIHAVPHMDALICDYNYVFSPQAALGKFNQTAFAEPGKPNLIIDEAHNLPARALDYYSAELSVGQLERFAADVETIPLRFQKKILKLLRQCVSLVKSLRLPAHDLTHQIEPPLKIFTAQDAKLRDFLGDYLNSDLPIAENDPVMQLSFYWGEFTNTLNFIELDADKFFTTYTPATLTVKITCCDASVLLQPSYEQFAQIVGFSATLKPFDYYSKLSGLYSDKLKTAEFVTQFPRQRRKILIIPQVSSKYSARERNYPRIADVIARIAPLRRGNYFVFFPSFDFLGRVLDIFIPPEGFTILRQERGMGNVALQSLLQHLTTDEGAHLFFAVQGGVFAEGMDYPGNMAIGVFVVGPPLPNFDTERELMRQYYQREYKAGFDYAYTFPAMTKAIQAAGRVIRSETDKGLIVLLDNRFIQSSYSRCMPQDWYVSSPVEMVSQNILRDVSEFWASVDEVETAN